MIHKIDVTLPLEESHQKTRWKEEVAKKLKTDESRIADIRLLKRSIDARRKQIKVQLRLDASVGESLPPEREYTPDYPWVGKGAPRLVIVGMGPAGMFAALRAIELGWLPVLLERGKDAIARRFDLAPILREGRVIEDSNYCFGE